MAGKIQETEATGKQSPKVNTYKDWAGSKQKPGVNILVRNQNKMQMDRLGAET